MTKVHYKIIVVLLLTINTLLSNTYRSYGQNCGCTVTFKKSQAVNGVNILDGRKAPYNRLKPGNTLCIQAGNYKELRFINFRGNGGRPITIKNCGGRVTTQNGINILGSRHVKFSGAGTSSIKYGFKVARARGTGLDVKGLSSNIEIENVEIQNTGFAGIMVKTDPQCNQPKTWRKNFTFYGLKIHDCYIHDTHAEGMYIGYTGGFERSGKKCGGKPIFGHLLKSVRIYDNLIVRSGWDGFQLNLAVQDVQVYRNTVIGYGTKRVAYQNFGWSIGGGTRGKFYSNFIYQFNAYKKTGNPQNLKSSGVQVISNQDTFFYNNVIVNSERHGIFIHNRLSSNLLNFREGYHFANNTIVGSGNSGIFYNAASTLRREEKLNWRRVFYNNLVVAPKIRHERNRTWKSRNENFVDFNTQKMLNKAKSNTRNNVYLNSIGEAKFTRPNNLIIDARNYQLTNGSRAINAGLNNARSFGVSADYNEARRTNTFDAGAFEYGSSSLRGGKLRVEAIATRAGNRVNFQFKFNKGGQASIVVEQLNGARVQQLYTGRIAAGTRRLDWKNARGGLYRIKIRVGNQEVSKIMKV